MISTEFTVFVITVEGGGKKYRVKKSDDEYPSMDTRNGITDTIKQWWTNVCQQRKDYCDTITNDTSTATTRNTGKSHQHESPRIVTRCRRSTRFGLIHESEWWHCNCSGSTCHKLRDTSMRWETITEKEP